MARTSKAKEFDTTVKKIDSLVQLLSGKHVKRVVIDGIEIEFDTAIAAIHAAEMKEQSGDVATAKDAASGSERLRQLLKEESEETLMWSTGQ